LHELASRVAAASSGAAAFMTSHFCAAKGQKTMNFRNFGAIT
jgi:hypothetical protein